MTMTKRAFTSLCRTAGLACTFVLVACSDDTTVAHDSKDAQSNGEKDSGAGDAKPADLDSGGDNLVVELDDGVVQGDMAGEARRFLGIPYAKPPLGELRWKAPMPPEPWTGVRHEAKFVENCPQLMDQGSEASNNEDCLYLNVWAPEPPTKQAPVMVWIYGGGNFSGGVGNPIPNVEDSLWYDGQFFASRQGVVLVTFNYRIGPLGFFAHPALADEGSPMGNQGLLDQRRALEWVRDNIEKFGGDPDNVTIFGESAGAGDICYHMVSPGSRGLFHRAIGQSGGCTMRGELPSVGDVSDKMLEYAEDVGCEAGEDQLDCLRGVSIETLLEHSNQPMPGAGQAPVSSFPTVIDGEDGFLPAQPKNLFDRGELAEVPYLLGSNNDEGTTFVWRADSLTTEEAYMADLEARFGDAAPDVAELYPPSKFDGDFDAARARVVGDSVVCSVHDTARRAAKAGLTVYMYNFNVEWSLLPGILLAGHAAEISHVFGAPYLPMPDPDSEMVAEEMNAYWARFGDKGDPNGPSAPAEWPPFSVDNDRRLQLDPEWDVLKDFRAEECAFWRAYAGVE